MKFNKKLIILISIGVLTGLSCIIDKNLNVNLNLNIKNERPILKLSKISGKVHIDNNWTDSKIAGICTGNGTSSFPYIINNLEIDAKALGSCILIENSNDYFRIENCTLTNSGPDWTDSGIKMMNVENGEIINNKMTGNSNGIYIENCDNFLIFNNTLSNTRDLQLIDSNNVLMYLNNFKSNLIDFFFSNSTFICKSPKKVMYTYNGNTFTKYLGNYWRLYHGSDENNDGIGDTPNIYYDSITVYVDYYPLMQTTDNYIIKGFSEDKAIHGYSMLFLIAIVSITLLSFFKRKRYF